MFDIILRSPNLGQPLLVKKEAKTGVDTAFSVIFGAKADNLDVKSLLEGNIFLQSLSDTREILQKKSPGNSSLWTSFDFTFWNMEKWPSSIRNNLIPLRVDKFVQMPLPPWQGLTPSLKLLEEYKYAYKVDLCIASEYSIDLKVPQLFNFIQKIPQFSNPLTLKMESGIYNINFHSIYLHDRDWKDFNFIFAADSHIEVRNDKISGIINGVMGGDHPGTFINFNQNFRDFISYANALHQRREVDLIILAGDIVDYVCASPRFGEYESNFELFRDLVTSWPSKPGTVCGEELKVPIFTVLGNHDYRPFEYPLIAVVEYGIVHYNVFTVDESKTFGLTPEEAIAYYKNFATNWDDDDRICNGQIEAPAYDTDTALNFQLTADFVDPSYKGMINPDLNYVIPLGNHKIICLDCPEAGAFKSIDEGLSYHSDDGTWDKSVWNHINATPDSTAFSKDQIDFLKNNCASDGLKIIALHNPVIHTKGLAKPFMLRETTHKLLNDNASKIKLIEQLGLYNFIVSSCKFPPIYSNLVEWTQNSGWSVTNTPFFRRGEREIVEREEDGKIIKVIGAGDGVPAARFNEFMDIINASKVPLILSGHTHESFEYSVRREDNEIRYFHDYYIDGKVKGLNPCFVWQIDNFMDYPEPLNKSSNPKSWWDAHRTLNIHAPSVAAPKLFGQGDCSYIPRTSSILLENPDPDKTANLEKPDTQNVIWAKRENIGFLMIKVRSDVISSIDRIYFTTHILESLRDVAFKHIILDKISMRELASKYLLHSPISMQDVRKDCSLSR